MLKFSLIYHTFFHLELHHSSSHFEPPDNHTRIFQNHIQRCPLCLQFLAWRDFPCWLWFARCNSGCLGIFWGRKDWWWRQTSRSTGPSLDTLGSTEFKNIIKTRSFVTWRECIKHLSRGGGRGLVEGGIEAFYLYEPPIISCHCFSSIPEKVP